jgi:two-component system cell cycle sensor histidine kinase/response regulator CckA
MPAVRVLLVDDELPLLQLLEKYLRRQGFEVEAHSNSAAGLAAFEKAAGRFDLVIADLALPEIPGQELLARMRRINPGIRFLFCSGYLFEARMLPEPLQPLVGFLQKPFSPRMLAEAVEQLIACPSPSPLH